MKTLIIVIMSSIMILSCNNKNNIPSQIEDSKVISQNFDWLLGDWKRVNEQEDQETFETWVRNTNTKYSGIGFTLKDVDTISQEKMILIKLENKWILEVISKGDSVSTRFNMTEMDTGYFICENPAIEFPKKIKYWKQGNTIKAKVSNESMEIPFEFEKISKK